MSEFKNILISNLKAKVQVYAAPLTKKSCVVSFYISNKSATNLGYVSVMIRKTGVDYSIVNQVPISSGSTLMPLENNKLFLMEGDILFIEASEDSDVVISLIEDI